jgi:hypothetical protein
MKTYFPSLLQFIVPLFFGTLTLGGMGIALVVVSPIRTVAVIGGIVCLAIVACFYWLPNTLAQTAFYPPLQSSLLTGAGPYIRP